LSIMTRTDKNEYSDYLSSLFQIRLDSDYDPMYIVVKSDVMTQLEHAKEMVNDISSYLETQYNP
jgi:uncharacterized protein (UPF0332 family)